MNFCLNNQSHNFVGDFTDEFEQITGSGSEGAQQALEEVYHKVLKYFCTLNIVACDITLTKRPCSLLK